MALKTTIEGTGILTSLDVSARVWRLYGAMVDTIIVYTTIEKEETREWVALTESIAESTASAASQEGLPTGAVAAYSASEDQRAVGSYKLTKHIIYAPVTTITEEDYPT